MSARGRTRAPSGLLIDIGNSRLKWQWQPQIRESHHAPMFTHGAHAHEGRPVEVIAQLPMDLARPDFIYIANVTGPSLGQPVADALAQRWPVPVKFAQVQKECAGLRVIYEDPARLGVDRWLTMLALRAQAESPFVVANCGTALTFDAVDAQGQHLGGVIAPGLLTAQQAVLGATRFAAAPPSLSDEAGLGRDTEGCVRLGAVHACAGLIERLARHYAPAQARRVLAGGDAERLWPLLEGEWLRQDDLVLQGLRIFAEQDHR